MDRVSRWGFPRSRFTFDDTAAHLGGLSWFSVYLGRGQRIVLPDGTEWRLRAVSRGRFVCPVVVDGERRKVAMSYPGNRNYGIDTRDRSFVLNPASRSPRRAARWTLDEHETRLAVLTRRPYTVQSAASVPLAVALLAPVLMRFGVLGEAEMLPSIRPWG